MRSVLTLGLLLSLCASAKAATVHHHHRRHAAVYPNQGLIHGPASGWAYASPPVRYAPAPY